MRSRFRYETEGSIFRTVIGVTNHPRERPMISRTSVRSFSSTRTRKLINVAKALTLALLLAVGVTAEAYADPALIVAIGADNVNGKGKGKNYPGGVGRNEAFPAQLEALLRAQQIDARVANEGAAGDTTPGILSRLDSAVPDGTRLVILDIAKGNDTRAGGNGTQNDVINGIKTRLDARHIALFTLPDWKEIPGLMANRDPDGHHFTAKGHAAIAAYLLPKVTAILGGQAPETVAAGSSGQTSRGGDCPGAGGTSDDGCSPTQVVDPEGSRGRQRDRTRRRGAGQ
jgi:acyl-CoA thioesterase-1